MIRRFTKTLLAALVLGPVLNVVCPAQSPPPLTHHVQDVVLSGQAQLTGRLPATQSMRIVLVLPLRNEAALQTFLQNLYDPASPSYRQFLSVDQFTAAYGPTQDDYDALQSFARSKGLEIAATSRNRLNLDVTGTVSSIEAALHVTMGVYQHPTEARTFYSPDREPTLDLAIPLWHIAGLDNYSIPQPLLSLRPPGVQPAATTGSCPSQSFCGSDMRAAYYGGTLTGFGQSVGLLEYIGTDLDDLNTYYTNAGQTNHVPVTLKSTDGTSTSCLVANGCDDTEPTIDLTQALGMAPGLSSLVMYVGSSDSAIFNAMATASPLDAQLSSSWSWSPADPGTDDPYFKEFAAQGQNLFQATGDSAAWGSGSRIFPADDPYITGVGGTDLSTVSAHGAWAAETAWANGGGGISPDKYAIPSWQAAAAAGCARCSQTYRNGPDVAANSNYTFYVCSKQTTCTANSYGGTSFAAPMWAGYMALVNEQAVNNGKPPLGFINPAIYAIAASSTYNANFHDISGGSNGFSAAPGYDLATGWGSPNGVALIGSLTGTSHPSGFTLTASPIAVPVAQGGSGSSTITSTVMNGFNAAVSLTATGQPTGVTVGFSPSSITGNGTSNMSITVAATTAPGTYPIAVTGTAGSSISTATVLLTVNGTVPDFTIKAQPKAISVQTGGRGTIRVTTTVANGFNAALTLTATGGGAGLTMTFKPATIGAPGAGTSTLTIDVAREAAVANHKIVVTATGGGITHTDSFTLKVSH